MPDIFGKEKRKTAPSKEGKLGVEGISREILESALKKAGIANLQGQNEGQNEGRTNSRSKGRSQKPIFLRTDFREAPTAKQSVPCFYHSLAFPGV